MVGAAAQATVPGVYAWGVTVAPGGRAREALTLARAGAVAALVMLALGVFGERRWAGRTRAASLWGLLPPAPYRGARLPAGLAPLRMEKTHLAAWQECLAVGSSRRMGRSGG